MRKCPVCREPMATQENEENDLKIAGMVVCSRDCYQAVVDEQSRVKARELGIATYQDELFGRPPRYGDP